MKKNLKKIIILVLIIVVTALCTLFAVKQYLLHGNEQLIDNYYNYDLQLEREYGTNDILEVQNIIDERIMDELNTGDYTVEEPYIVENPYGRNGLSAYVVIPTDQAVKYSYTVKGKTEETSFSYSVDEYEQNPMIPVVALYNNYTNSVFVTLENEAGDVSKYKYSIRVSPEVDEDTANGIEINSSDEEAYQEVVSGQFIFDGQTNGYDSDGELRFTGLSTYRNVFMNPINGKFLVGYDKESYLPMEYFASRVFEMNFIGKFNTDFQLVAPDGYGFHHDMIYDENTNKYYALMSYSDSEDTYSTDGYGEGFIGIYDAETLEFEKMINTAENIPSDILVGPESLENDIHYNSIAYNDERNEIIVSSRSTGALYGIDSETGDFNWVLDNPETLTGSQKDIALDPVGDNMTYTHGQHSVYLRDNSKYADYIGDNKFVVSVFDNNYVQYDENGNLKYSTLDGNQDSVPLETINPENVQNLEGGVSRIVTYAVDVDNNTFEVLEDYDLSALANWTSNVYDVLDEYYVSYISSGNMDVLDFDGNLLIEITGLRGGYRGRIYSEEEIQNFM